MKFIDVRSDTVTQPTDAMRNVMCAAIVGDDVYDDDPTTKELETLAAAMTGKEAALFVPSGTMGNQLAIMGHTNRGNEIIVHEHYHIVAHEVGGAAILSSVNYKIIKSTNDLITEADIDDAVRGEDIHYPDTGMVCLENALSNGTVVSLDDMKSAYDAAKKYHLPVHLDGARLFNAAVALNCTAQNITQYCDSVMFCLSKGLCAPVGSMLCGSKAFIHRAKKHRKLLGGGMRQTGILASAGLLALNQMTQRLHEDHDNASYLAAQLKQMPHIELDIASVHINMVFFKITKTNFDHVKFVSYLYENGIKSNGAEHGLYRFVTHHDVRRTDIDQIIDTLKRFISHE